MKIETNNFEEYIQYLQVGGAAAKLAKQVTKGKKARGRVNPRVSKEVLQERSGKTNTWHVPSSSSRYKKLAEKSSSFDISNAGNYTTYTRRLKNNLPENYTVVNSLTDDVSNLARENGIALNFNNESKVFSIKVGKTDVPVTLIQDTNSNEVYLHMPHLLQGKLFNRWSPKVKNVGGYYNTDEVVSLGSLTKPHPYNRRPRRRTLVYGGLGLMALGTGAQAIITNASEQALNEAIREETMMNKEKLFNSLDSAYNASRSGVDEEGRLDDTTKIKPRVIIFDE